MENRRPHSRQNAPVQYAHALGLAMFSYANDNNGKYPTGHSSTEVFQKLIDGDYISDPSILYLSDSQFAGKSPSTSNRLRPENVCWDVTVPADSTDSDGSLPLVFSAGYRIEYIPNGRAIPLSKKADNFFAVFYTNNSATILLPVTTSLGSNSVVAKVTSATFDAKGVKYIQLTPDGPLAP